MKKREEIENAYKWDLKRIYENENSFKKDLSEISSKIDDLKSFEGKIMNSSENLLAFLKKAEETEYILSKLVVYTNLRFFENSKIDLSNKNKLLVDNILNEYNLKTSFVLNELLSSDYKKLLSDDELAHYQFYFEKLNRYKKHTLSKDKENLIAKAVNQMGEGTEAFFHLNNTDLDYGEITINNQEEKLTRQLYEDILSKYKRDIRKSAMEKVNNYYKERKNTTTSLYKSIINESYFIKDVRNYKNTLNMNLYDDNINEKVYFNLIDSVNENLEFHYKLLELKRKYHNYDKLYLYDLHKNIEDNIQFNFSDAKNVIRESLKPLGDEYVKVINKALNESWIDVYPNEGKRSGAFQWGIYKKPFVMLNYNNNLEDVFTTAHEIGHAIHTYLSDYNQSMTYNNYPIFLAEIASTVNEILLFKYLYEQSKNKEEKIKYLFKFLDSFRNTVFRQTMFSEFEYYAHSLKDNNEVVTSETLCNYYLNLNNKYFKNINVDEFIQYEWMRVPHFYTPFYVYKYATGFLSAILIAFNLDEKKYTQFLKSGGSKYPLDTLKELGIDLNEKETINKAFKYFNTYLNELEELLGDIDE